MSPKTILDVGREAAAAGHKAAAEGEAIVRRAREACGLSDRPAGPERPWPAPPESGPEPDYYLTERDLAAIHIINWLTQLIAVTVKPGLFKALQRDLSRHLQRLRDAPGRGKAEWLAIVKRECGLGRNRAYEMAAFSRNNSVGNSNASAKNPSETGRREG